MKGLIFTHNVGAILSGQKTLTRRIIKAEIADWVDAISFNEYQDCWQFHGYEGGMKTGSTMFPGQSPLKCPYKVGEHRYIKERWRTTGAHDNQEPSDLNRCYDTIQYSDMKKKNNLDNRPLFGKWRSPLFMCKWMSRGTVEITDVGAERVQDITDADIVEEGITYQGQVGLWDEWIELWDEINGPGSWEANPWVWRVEIEVVK